MLQTTIAYLDGDNLNLLLIYSQQLINEVKIEQEISSMHSFVRKEKIKNTSDLNSILEVDDEKDEEDDKGSIDDTRDIYTDQHHHQKNSGEDLSETPRSPRSNVNANSLSVLRQRCELDAAAHGIFWQLYIFLRMTFHTISIIVHRFFAILDSSKGYSRAFDEKNK